MRSSRVTVRCIFSEKLDIYLIIHITYKISLTTKLVDFDTINQVVDGIRINSRGNYDRDL